LSVVTVELPSLPERTADILPLAEHFIGVYGEKLQRPLPTLDRDAKQALLGYAWPGNIRELENVMHAAVLVAGATIQRGDLRLVPWASTAGIRADRPAAAETLSSPLDQLAADLDALFGQRPDQLMERLESLLVARALEFCRGNQVHTAKLLGITRNVLRTYLKRFGLLSAVARRSQATAVPPGFVRYPLHYRSGVPGELA
jgi:sigma-54-specific transcriptional regulator